MLNVGTIAVVDILDVDVVAHLRNRARPIGAVRFSGCRRVSLGIAYVV
jgi:hypothetical protein